MLQKVSSALCRISSIWTVVAAIIVYGFFIARVMPEQSADSAAYAGDWGAPDRHLFYTPDELYAAVGTWGEAGREDYTAFRLGLDIAWALAYTAFLLTVTSFALRGAYPAGDRRRLLNLTPLIPLTFDYLENAACITLVNTYPERLNFLAWIAALLTGAKWSTLAASHLVMLYALVASAWARFR